jgi:hypothetical protein
MVRTSRFPRRQHLICLSNIGAIKVTDPTGRFWEGVLVVGGFLLDFQQVRHLREQVWIRPSLGSLQDAPWVAVSARSWAVCRGQLSGAVVKRLWLSSSKALSRGAELLEKRNTRLLLGFAFVAIGIALGVKEGARPGSIESTTRTVVVLAIGLLFVVLGGAILSRKTIDERETTQYSWPKQEVVEAIKRAVLKVRGMSLDPSRTGERQLVIKSRTNWKSWGERIVATIQEDDSLDRTIVSWSSTPLLRFTVWDWGKNRENIDRLIKMTKEELSS